MSASVTRITVSVADLGRSRGLYEDVLGLVPAYSMPGMSMLRSDSGIELQLHERPPAPSDAGVAISFGVENVDVATALAVVAGASVVKEPADQPWGERQAVLRDVDGHVVCLVGVARG